MSTAETPAEPYVCDHCDDSVPHRHVDEKPLVEGYRTALRRSVLGVAAVGLLLAVAVVLGGRAAALAIPLGAAAWTVSSAVGLLVLSLVQTRRPTPAAVIAGAVATAAAAPLLALLVAAASDGAIGWRALAGTLGWLAVSGTVSGIRAGQLGALLTSHTREGEAARSGVVRTDGRPSPYIEAAWLVATAVVFGLCVAATAALPVLVVVLVPLNVALAVLSRRLQTHAGRAA
jgi:hypothetical protein